MLHLGLQLPVGDDFLSRNCCHDISVATNESREPLRIFLDVKPLVRGGHPLESGDGSTVLSNHHPTEQLGGRHGHYTIISPQKLGGTE